MSAGDITPVLQAASSADQQVRNAGEAQLQLAEQQNPSAYMAALASELANSEKPADIRQIAGILLKNALDAPGADATKKVRHAVLDINPSYWQPLRGCCVCRMLL